MIYWIVELFITADDQVQEFEGDFSVLQDIVVRNRHYTTTELHIISPTGGGSQSLLLVPYDTINLYDQVPGYSYTTMSTVTDKSVPVDGMSQQMTRFAGQTVVLGHSGTYRVTV